MFPSYPNAKYFLICIFGLTLFYYTFTANDLVVGFLSDDAVYLMQTELYSPWHSEKSSVVKFIQTESFFPPLYPVLMAILGVDTSTPALASNITIGFLLLLFLLLGIWSWRESNSTLPALSIPICFALLPSTLLMAQGLWSEFLFMCLIYGAFTCVNEQKLSNRHWLLAALLVGLSSLTRAIGITMVTGFILLLLLRRPRRFWLYALISLIPFLSWSLIRDIGTGGPSYLAKMEYLLDQNSLLQLLQILSDKLTVLSHSWFWLFSVKEANTIFTYITVFITTILFICTLAGFALRLQKLKVDAICVPFYLTAILLWPATGVYFVSRFLYPLLPLFLLYIWFGLQYFSSNTSMQRVTFPICLLLVCIIAFPSSQHFITRGYTELGVHLNPYKRARSWLLTEKNAEALEVTKKNKDIIETLPQLTKYIPEQECVYALQSPLVMLYAKRITYVFPSNVNSTKELLADKGPCRFYLAMPLTDMDKSYPPYYPLQYDIDNKNFEVIPFYPGDDNRTKPILFLLKRLIP